MNATSRVIVRNFRRLAGLVIMIPTLFIEPAGAQTAPQLAFTNAGSQLSISWPMGVSGYVLQWTTNLEEASSWQPVFTPPSEAGQGYVVTVQMAYQQAFFRLGPITAPMAVTTNASGVNYDSALLSGTVNSGGDAATTAYFEYGTTTNYSASTAQIGTGIAPQTLRLTIPYLIASTTYHYRLVAINTRGTNYGADTNFTTGVAQPGQAPPAVQTLTPGYDFTGTFSFHANVTPQSTTSHVYFQYGTTTNYGSATPVGSIFSNSTGLLGVGVTNLIPSTSYHCRIVAYNGGGTSFGNDIAFESPAQ